MRRREGFSADSSAANGDESKPSCTSNNGTPSTVGSLTPTKEIEDSCETPAAAERKHPVATERRKTGFLAFFGRNDARQIKKIVYPHDKKDRPGRLRFVDFVYLFSVGLLCIGLSGLKGFNDLLESPPNFLIGHRPRTLLPPNSKIPPELRLGVERRRLPLQLLLEGVVAQGKEPPTDTAPPRSHETLDNRTSVDDILDNRTATEKYRYALRPTFSYPKRMSSRVYQEGTRYKDFGNVNLRFLENSGDTRRIYRGIWEREGRARHLNQPRDDDTEQYWAFDDDWLRNPLVSFDDANIQDIHHCRRTKWHRLSFHTGNLLHEIDLVTHTPTLVGEGAYREVFVVERPLMGVIEQFVLKEIRFDSDMEYDTHEYVRVDSLVTERMTSNPQVVDLYGYSGYSMLAECFVNGDVEEAIVGFDDRDRDFDPLGEPELRTWNNFTGSEKLKLALSMVQPVAALHNYKDGIIIHDDIQLSQFLWTDETKTSVKLNDFNRAEVMTWDEEYKEYCKFRNGRGGGDWRAPEEYRDEPLDQKIDVWSLGNNFYSLLGGYYPFYDVEEGESIRRKIARGEIAEIDPRFYHRSFAERKLFEVIERCHVPNSNDRADINEILRMLEEAIADDEWYQARNLTGLEEDEGRAHHSTSEDEGDDQGEYDDDHGGDDHYHEGGEDHGEEGEGSRSSHRHDNKDTHQSGAEESPSTHTEEDYTQDFEGSDRGHEEEYYTHAPAERGVWKEEENRGIKRTQRL